MVNDDVDPEYFSLTRKEILPLLPTTTHSVLELGCGAGATMAWIRTIRNIEYAAGIELSKAAATEAATVFDDVAVGNIESLNINFGRPFDTILALDVLEHLANPWSTLLGLHSLLEPNGVIISSIPNVAHYSVVLPLVFRGSWDYKDRGLLDKTHLRFFTKKTAINLFNDSGFWVDKIEYVRQYPNIFGIIANSSRWRWYNHRIMSQITRGRLFNFQFLIRARSNAEVVTAVR